MSDIELNPIDEVMRRCMEDPTLLAPSDIDEIRDYYIDLLRKHERGEKPMRRASAKLNLDAPAISLESLGMKKTPTISLPRPKFK